MSKFSINHISSKQGQQGPVLAGITTVNSSGVLRVPVGFTGQQTVLKDDPYIDNLVLALPFNGDSKFTDISPKRHGNPGINTGIGNTTDSIPYGMIGVGTTAVHGGISTHSKYYGHSLWTNGGHQALTYVGGAHDWDLTGGNINTGQWTIEFWFYPYNALESGVKVLGTRALKSGGSSVGWEIVYKSFQMGVEAYEPYSTSGQQRNTTGISSHTWTHVAFCYKDEYVRGWQDGNSDGCLYKRLRGTWASGVDDGSLKGGALRIGKPWTYNDAPQAFMQDLRIYKGVAKYDVANGTSFTVPDQIAL